MTPPMITPPSTSGELIEQLEAKAAYFEDCRSPLIAVQISEATCNLLSAAALRIRELEAELKDAHHTLMSIDEHQGLVARKFLDREHSRALAAEARSEAAEARLASLLNGTPPHAP